MNTGKIYVVGIGPGNPDEMTMRAKKALEESDIIAGYKTYIALVRGSFPDKEFFENGMRGEAERCEKCVEYALGGKKVSLICSGDAGVYGMASPLYETAFKNGFKNIEVIPGVTAALSGSAVLGAALSHDFCVISLSDLLTPWEVIERRLIKAAEGDFCIAIYNPSSKTRSDYLKKACEILLTVLSPDTSCGYVRNIGRDGTEKKTCTLAELKEQSVDMFTTVFIGNSKTEIREEMLITPRGYEI